MNLFEAGSQRTLLIKKLEPYCERIEIAGSVRRGKPNPGDIELVAIPKTRPTLDLFGNQDGEFSLLYDRKVIQPWGIIQKFGERYCKVDLFGGEALDLFIVLPPADWGVIYTIRTGPVYFSHWIVTPRKKGGALPNGWRCEDGRIWDGQTEMRFGEEREFLKWLGLGWIEPGERAPKWNYFRRQGGMS